VRSRLLLGVAAWLGGASAATGCGLLAVNMLGQGVTPAAGERLSVARINQALASEAAERTAVLPRFVSPRISSSASAPSPPAPTARHPAPPAPPGTNAGTVLTSQGGTVVANCAGARAYLVSWSPQPGFGSGGVIRGPATSTQVTFTSGQLTVTMIVSCYAGAPTATATASAVSTGALTGDGD
jgi:hypothetical protein